VLAQFRTAAAIEYGARDGLFAEHYTKTPPELGRIEENGARCRAGAARPPEAGLGPGARLFGGSPPGRQRRRGGPTCVCGAGARRSRACTPACSAATPRGSAALPPLRVWALGSVTLGRWDTTMYDDSQLGFVTSGYSYCLSMALAHLTNNLGLGFGQSARA
jgi:hypothetical protein